MHPILFHIGSFPIATYGVMIMIGVVAAVALAVHLGKKRGIDPNHIYDLSFVVLLTGFLGARALFILTEFDRFLDDPLSLLLAREGFVFAGGFVGATAAAIVFIRRHKLPIWEIGDIAGPSLALAHAVGRIGCFFAGCCFGGVCKPGAWYGVSFPHILDNQGHSLFSYAYHDHLAAGLIPASAAGSLAVFPTQILESVTNFVITAILLLAWRRRRFPGQIFIYYLVLYGLARFGLEFLRGDASRGYWFNTPISTSQGIYLIVIAVAGVLWTVLRPKAPLARPRAAHGK